MREAVTKFGGLWGGGGGGVGLGGSAAPAPGAVFARRLRMAQGGRRGWSVLCHLTSELACSGLGAGAAHEGHLVDALVPRGDEGRGTLRKAEGRGERPVILGCPNGATHPFGGITW